MRELMFWTTLLVLSPVLLLGFAFQSVRFSFEVGQECANEFHNYIAE